MEQGQMLREFPVQKLKLLRKERRPMQAFHSLQQYLQNS